MSGYAYASTRVRSREKKLLKKDQIKLLVSAATAETALKQLGISDIPKLRSNSA